MVNRIRLALSACSVLFFYNMANAGPIEGPKSIFELMLAEDVLPLTIEVDLDTVMARRKSKEGIATSLHFVDQSGERQEWEVKLTVRGSFRRVHCAVPPLKLNFKKGDLRDKGLAEFDDFKLVTQCTEDPDLARELILREYLAYRLYNELTDHSYRVQLVKITFRNSAIAKEDVQWGFLIEDSAELSFRIGGESVEHAALPVDSFHREDIQMVSVFQEMIGNDDWGVRPSKNIRYFRKEGKIIPVPYDFDFSELVGAPYAQSTRLLRDNNIVPNPYGALTPSIFGEDIESTVTQIQSKRKDLLTTIRKCKELMADSRLEMISLLDRFLKSPLSKEEKIPGIPRPVSQ